jgi:arylsulfatase A-like enzyme
LISGRYQQRFAIERPLGAARSIDSSTGLPATGRSLPQLLANAGYVTALVGKWHLGYRPEFSPRSHGFGYFFGFKSGFTDYYQHTDGNGEADLFENDSMVTATGYMTDMITARSVDFIAHNRDKPFFIDVAYNAAHWPYQVPDSPSVAIDHGRHLTPFDQATNTRAQYVKILERADRGVGDIVRALDSLGLAANTIVIFTNDNGGEWLSRNTPLFHNKASVWEGGIRVPAIIRWPGRIPRGTVSPQVAITMDLTASVLAAAGANIPADAALDGVNIFPILEKRTLVVERNLFWRVSGVRNQQAVRSGDWKLLIDDGRPMLFDVHKDLGERNNMIGLRPDIAQRLRPLLDKWQQDVDADAKQGRWVTILDASSFRNWKVAPGDAESKVVESDTDKRIVAGDAQRDGKWEFKNGILHGEGGVSHIFSPRNDYENFDYSAEIRIKDKGNSGQYFRTAFGPGFPSGYEAQVNSTHTDPVRTGSLYSFRNVTDMLVPPDTWFTQEVIADGNHIVIKVNDKVTVDYVDEKRTFMKGHFAFQQHNLGSEVWIRNVQVRELPKP